MSATIAGKEFQCEKMEIISAMLFNCYLHYSETLLLNFIRGLLDTIFPLYIIKEFRIWDYP